MNDQIRPVTDRDIKKMERELFLARACGGLYAALSIAVVAIMATTLVGWWYGY